MVQVTDFAVGAVCALVFIGLARLLRGLQIPLLAVAVLAAAVPYVVLGLESHSASELGIEIGGVALFAVLAALGIRGSPWWVAAAWGLHAAWDVVLPTGVDTSYMPPWYEALCAGFDCVVALYVVALIRSWLPATGFRRIVAD